MNLYQKMAKTREELQNLKLKKSGLNNYSNYTYYELGDFLPAINSLCAKYELFTQFNIVTDHKAEKAVLTVYNASEPSEKVSFVAPTAEVEIGKKKDGSGGAEPIQNLGGKITYMRRYMLFTAFEMVESDSVDSIKRDLTDEVDQDDADKISNTQNSDELKSVCASLKDKYKISLITPLFEAQRTKLTQKESKA